MPSEPYTKYSEYLFQSVGNTPCIEVNTEIFGLPGRLFLKLENLNPTGTIKDRYAKWVVESAKNSNLVDISTGNYGISLSLFASLKRKKATVFVSHETSLDKVTAITKHGGRVIFSKAQTLEEVQVEAKEFCEKSGFYYSRQYLLDKSVNCSEKTIAQEILTFQENNLLYFDAIVAPCGSGSTVQGIRNIIKKDILFSPVMNIDYHQEDKDYAIHINIENEPIISNGNQLLMNEGVYTGPYGKSSLTGSIMLLREGYENVLCIISDK